MCLYSIAKTITKTSRQQYGSWRRRLRSKAARAHTSLDRRARVPLPPPKQAPNFGAFLFFRPFCRWPPSNNKSVNVRRKAMAKKDLIGKKVAVLVDEGFEQVELIKPRKALDRAGAETLVVSPQETEVRAWNMKRWGKSVAVDVSLDTADPSQFDSLLLPGGVMNPDKLRMNPKAVEFVKHFVDAGKPIASISYAPWLLLEAGGVK